MTPTEITDSAQRIIIQGIEASINIRLIVAKTTLERALDAEIAVQLERIINLFSGQSVGGCAMAATLSLRAGVSNGLNQAMARAHGTQNIDTYIVELQALIDAAETRYRQTLPTEERR